MRLSLEFVILRSGGVRFCSNEEGMLLVQLNPQVYRQSCLYDLADGEGDQYCMHCTIRRSFFLCVVVYNLLNIIIIRNGTLVSHRHYAAIRRTNRRRFLTHPRHPTVHVHQSEVLWRRMRPRGPFTGRARSKCTTRHLNPTRPTDTTERGGILTQPVVCSSACR